MAFKSPLEQALSDHDISVTWKVPHTTMLPRFKGLLLRTYDNLVRIYYISSINTNSFTCLAISHPTPTGSMLNSHKWLLDHELYILAKAAKGNISVAFNPDEFRSLFNRYRSIKAHEGLIADHIADARKEGSFKL